MFGNLCVNVSQTLYLMSELVPQEKMSVLARELIWGFKYNIYILPQDKHDWARLSVLWLLHLNKALLLKSSSNRMSANS